MIDENISLNCGDLRKFAEIYEQKFLKVYKEKFIEKFDSNFEIIFSILERTDNIILETKSLFSQAYHSLEIAQGLLEDGNIIESMGIVRSAFENIMMSVLINESEDIYKEFKKVCLPEQERKFTKIRYLRNMFNRKLKNDIIEIFPFMSGKEAEKLLNELYDKLCLYTHSTLVVSLFAEVKKNDDDKIVIPLIEFNIILIKFLLLKSIESVVDYNTEKIDFRYHLVNFLFQFPEKFKEDKYTCDYFSQYNILLYPKINESDFANEKNYKKLFEILNELKDLKEICNNKNISEFLVNLIIEMNEI